MADKEFRWFPNRVIFNIVATAKKAQVDYLSSWIDVIYLVYQILSKWLALILLTQGGRLRSKHYDYVFRVPQYKFFGCHVGALYGRYELLDHLKAYKVRPAEDIPPHKFETGTKGLSDNSLLSVGGSSQVGWVTRSRL